jgi:molybdate transport system ATP-binding protein
MGRGKRGSDGGDAGSSASLRNDKPKSGNDNKELTSKGADMVEHRVRVKGRRGALELDVRLELRAGWTVLFGPSGCGKTSVLRAIAGLARDGEIEVGRWVGDAAWEEMGGLAPEMRGIAYAPQSGALFPHLTVAENVEFGYEVCRDAVREATIVDSAMELFSLRLLSDRMPGQLSGGEAQRVNLARAFAKPGARWMLLDEPFAGMDRGRRDALLPQMAAWVKERGLAVLSVTHDVEEAWMLGAEVVRMVDGGVVAQGEARVVLAEEGERMRRVLG